MGKWVFLDNTNCYFDLLAVKATTLAIFVLLAFKNWATRNTKFLTISILKMFSFAKTLALNSLETLKDLKPCLLNEAKISLQKSIDSPSLLFWN